MLTPLKILCVPQNCPEVNKKARVDHKEHNKKKGIYMEQQGNVAAA